MLNIKPEPLSQNDDCYDGYDEMMHAWKHQQRESKLVEHIGDRCKEIKNLRTSEQNIHNMSQPRWWDKKQAVFQHAKM